MTAPPAGQPVAGQPVARQFVWINGRGIWTLYRRELARGLKLAVITLAAPAIRAVLFATVFALVTVSIGADTPRAEFLAFLIPGLIAAAIFERAFEATAFSLVFDKMEGVIGDVVRAPLTPAEILFAYSLSSASSGLLTGLVVALALLPFAFGLPAAPLILLGFAAAGAYMFALFAMIAGLWARKWDHISAAQTFVVVPVVFLSGVFFSLDRLPPTGQALVRANPVFYAVDGVRAGMTGRFEADPLVAATVILATILVLLGISYRLLATGYRLKD